MKLKILSIIFSILSGFVFLPVHAQIDTSLINIPYTNAEIQADGQLNDWHNYFEYTFSDTAEVIRNPLGYPIDGVYKEGVEEVIKFPRSRNLVSVWLCWNHDNLNVAFTVKDKHLFAEIDKGNDNPYIYLNDGVEIYIDSYFDSEGLMDVNDYQFMVDVLNNSIVFRGDYHKMDDPEYRVPKDMGQNVLFYSAVNILGHFNDSLRNDTGYIVELVIPFAGIGLNPTTGTTIKLDLCINDNDRFLSEYIKVQGEIPFTWHFNWVGYNDFGFPEAWRNAKLTGGPGWFERASGNMKKSWIYLFISIVAFSFVVFIMLFIKINKLRKMPHHEDVIPAKVLFIRGETPSEQSLSINQQYLQKANDYIITNANKSLNSEEIADELCISLRKLQRLTKEEMNCTPTNFIWIVKLNLASEFIKTNKGSISETAYEFGFSSPSYFSKLFKDYFGQSPIDYKKNVPDL